MEPQKVTMGSRPVETRPLAFPLAAEYAQPSGMTPISGRFLSGAASRDCSFSAEACVDVLTLLALRPEDLLGSHSEELIRMVGQMSLDAGAILDLCGLVSCGPSLRAVQPMVGALSKDQALRPVAVKIPASPPEVTRRRISFSTTEQDLTADLLCSVFPAEAGPEADCTLTVNQGQQLRAVYGGAHPEGQLVGQVAVEKGSITYSRAPGAPAMVVLEGSARGE